MGVWLHLLKLTGTGFIPFNRRRRREISVWVPTDLCLTPPWYPAIPDAIPELALVAEILQLKR